LSQAQRVVAVLEDAVEHMALISLVPTMSNTTYLEQIREARLRDAVRRQWQVEESLRVHFGSEGSTTTTYAEVTDQMHASTRELCQWLKADNLPQKPFVQEGMSKNIIEYQQSNMQRKKRLVSKYNN